MNASSNMKQRGEIRSENIRHLFRYFIFALIYCHIKEAGFYELAVSLPEVLSIKLATRRNIASYLRITDRIFCYVEIQA